MKKDKKPQDKFSELRRQAEETLQKGPADFRELSKLSAEETRRLAHDLRVHQIELETQNEELLRAQLDIEAARDKYSDLYDFAPVGYFTIGEGGLIIEANLTGSAMLGVERRFLIGKPLSRFIAREDEDIFYFHRNKVFKTKNRRTCELRMVKNKGAQFHAQLESIAVQDSDGSVSHSRTIISDITERKQAEEALRKAKETAEEATKLKDKFVSLVSHDLKNPLTAMLSYIKLLREGTFDCEKTKEMLQRASDTGEKMNEFIDELLSISRLKIGAIILKPVFMDACFNIKNVLTSFHYLAEKKKLKLTNKIPERTRVYADQTLFCQVIQNMVSNAVKFCKEGDTITLFVPENEPSTIAVADTGVGIKPSRLETLFIFNYEVKTSTRGTDGETGTGLGLPLSRDIMEAHGGNLRVEAKPGQGSVFYAKLPFVRPLILIVDDEEVFRIEQRRYLKQIDVDIREAENGEDALKIIEKTRPHLIITDIRMPIMDGFELLERVKKGPESKSIPYIIVTMDINMEVREKAFRLGADDFVNKPLNPDDFIPRVRRFVV